MVSFGRLAVIGSAAIFSVFALSSVTEGSAFGCSSQKAPNSYVDAGAAMPLATSEMSAQVTPKNSSTSPQAVQLTLRPTELDPDANFMVQVYATHEQDRKGSSPGQLLGTVAFFPLKLGQAQEFVLPAPLSGAATDVQLTIKIISANPDQPVKRAAVEVMNAQFAP
jgi:hypothetical protein